MGLANHSISSNVRAGRVTQLYRVMENKAMKYLFDYVVALPQKMPHFAHRVVNPS